MTTDRPPEPVEPVPTVSPEGDGLLQPVPYDPALDDIAGLPPEQVLEKKPSRAGRDLPTAIAVGVGLGALIISTLLIRKESFAVVMALAVMVAIWELRAALRHAGVEAPFVPAIAGSSVMMWAAYVYGPAGLTVAWALTCAVVVIYRAAGRLEGAGRDVLGGVFILTYPTFLVGFGMLLLSEQDGVERIMVLIITAVCSDVGGYIAGVLFGKHPMAPTISPKKSWEGFAGSVLLCMVSGSLTVHLLLDHSWLIGAALGVGVAVAATVGDLLESLIKRDLGIKDMSHILPGHGGIMDRLDSLVVVAPVVWVVLALLAVQPA